MKIGQNLPTDKNHNKNRARSLYSAKSAQLSVDNICVDQRGYARGMIFTFALPLCVSSSSCSE